jgi:hypothetical protein
LGLDSLDAVEVVMAVEEEFSIEIPDAEADNITTVQEAIDYISKTPEGELHKGQRRKSLIVADLSTRSNSSLNMRYRRNAGQWKIENERTFCNRFEGRRHLLNSYHSLPLRHDRSLRLRSQSTEID